MVILLSVYGAIFANSLFGANFVCSYGRLTISVSGKRCEKQITKRYLLTACKKVQTRRAASFVRCTPCWTGLYGDSVPIIALKLAVPEDNKL